MSRFFAALALIAMIAAPTISVADSYRDTRTLAQIRILEGAINLFREDTGRLPSTKEGLRALFEQPRNAGGWRGPYLRSASLVIDSWGDAFLYQHPASHESVAYELYSTGVDLRDDLGRGDDITNWSGIPHEFYPRPFPWALVVLGLGILAAIAGAAFALRFVIRAFRRRVAAYKALQLTRLRRVSTDPRRALVHSAGLGLGCG